MKQRKTEQPESLTFDPTARQDYLTGFHKRKVARKKQAQETAVKKEREERVQQRKVIREKRRQDLEQHVNEVNTILKQQRQDLLGSGSDDSGGEDGRIEGEEWAGFDPEVPVIDKTEEYIDEDKYATVTIQEMDSVRDMLNQSDEEDAVVDASRPLAEPLKKRKTGGVDKPPKKKRSFRYETKSERQATRHKNNARNAKAAKARRDES